MEESELWELGTAWLWLQFEVSPCPAHTGLYGPTMGAPGGCSEWGVGLVRERRWRHRPTMWGCSKWGGVGPHGGGGRRWRRQRESVAWGVNLARTASPPSVRYPPYPSFSDPTDSPDPAHSGRVSRALSVLAKTHPEQTTIATKRNADGPTPMPPGRTESASWTHNT